ncbi:MAG: hypothetical protein C0621_08810, partial [Desulfuromonas sp.]
EEGIETAGWPKWDDAALIEDEKLIVVQVNGKVRGKVTVAADADNAAVENAALGEENVQRSIGEKNVRKVIVIPGRLVNIVVG